MSSPPGLSQYKGDSQLMVMLGFTPILMAVARVKLLKEDPGWRLAVAWLTWLGSAL
ncbi:Uncharacterised protein [Collinsella intestinalis]|nr:Uncharacterised protein [Collinsella intestinalis]